MTRIYPPFFLLFLFFSSSHGQFSKVQRALIIEEAGANNPGWIPVCAGGRKEEEGGAVEDHHHCRGLDTTDHGIVVATDGNGTGVFFVLIKKRKKSVIKSRCLPTMIYWSGSFAPAPSRLILIYLSGSRNSFDVRARLKGCRGGKLETFSRRPCFRADTILLLRVGNWYRLYNVRPVNFYTYEIERFEQNSSLITTTAA